MKKLNFDDIVEDVKKTKRTIGHKCIEFHSCNFRHNLIVCVPYQGCKRCISLNAIIHYYCMV